MKKENTAPSYEEFYGFIKSKMQERWSEESEQDIDEFLADAEDMIQTDYEKNLSDFESGELSADVFRNGGRYGLIMALELMY